MNNGNGTNYKMYAILDKKERMLKLNVAFNTIVKTNDEETAEVQESNVMYYFKIKKNGSLKFIQVRLAG
jgi:hypothetical protein